ncbi:MAG: hypothetical protein WDN04_23260 [Rhodospirillales bacterium]
MPSASPRAAPSHRRTSATRARAVAAEGAAGRAAGDAAQAAEDDDRQQQLQTKILLLQLLLEQAGGEPGPPSELHQRAFAAILRLAPRPRRTAETIADAIERLASLYAVLGIGPAPGQARCLRLANSIHHVLNELKAFADLNPGKPRSLPCWS